MRLLEGKKALILGASNQRSIGSAVARAFREHGASLALTYANDEVKSRVLRLGKETHADFVTEMDVTNEAHYESLRSLVKENWGTFDVLVHSIAYAPSHDLRRRFSETSRAGFGIACDVSAYSLVGLCSALKDCFSGETSVMAMTYYGSSKVLQGYNVMGAAKAALESSARYLAADLGPEGVRVNCISAGPIRTLASSAIPNFSELLDSAERNAPLRKNVTTSDVAGTAVYLASHLSRGVTGQVLFVDSGLNIVAQ